MEQDVNIIIEQYRQTLIEATQNSQLPIGVVRYIINDVASLINKEYDAYMRQVIAAQNQAAEKQSPQPEENEEITEK